jgi:hypothetical protein
MLPLHASGRLGAGAYRKESHQAYHPFPTVVPAALAVATGPAARRHGSQSDSGKN